MQSWSAFATLLGTAAALKAGVQNHELGDVLRAAVDVAGGVTLAAAESYDSYDAYDSYDYAGVYDYTYDSSLGAADATPPGSEDTYDYADEYDYLSDSGLGATQDAEKPWDYKSFHIGNWPVSYPKCDGQPHPDAKHNEWQSPIDLPTLDDIDVSAETPKFTALYGGCNDFHKKPSEHTFEAEFESKGCENLKVTWKKKTYTMLQFHFHSESENMINLEHYPGEMHLVHQADDGSYLVVGVFLERDPKSPKGNPFLTRMFDEGLRNMTRGGVVNPYEGVIESNAEFLSYLGSFTTPPCTSNVEWLSIIKPIPISSADLATFKEFLKNDASQVNSYYQNFRPIQPLKKRKFKKGTVKATYTTDFTLSSQAMTMAVSGPGPLDF